MSENIATKTMAKLDNSLFSSVDKRHKKNISCNLLLLKILNRSGEDHYAIQEFDTLTVDKCSFLFQNYTDIYNKVLKNEINLDILNKFLDALELIENGEVDQHEASVKVGTYLKELYVDSALKKTEKMDAENSNKDDEKKEFMEISWSEYKRVRS